VWTHASPVSGVEPSDLASFKPRGDTDNQGRGPRERANSAAVGRLDRLGPPTRAAGEAALVARFRYGSPGRSTHTVLTRSSLRWFLMVSSGQIESPLAPARTAISSFPGREAGLLITFDFPRLQFVSSLQSKTCNSKNRVPDEYPIKRGCQAPNMSRSSRHRGRCRTSRIPRVRRSRSGRSSAITNQCIT